MMLPFSWTILRFRASLRGASRGAQGAAVFGIRHPARCCGVVMSDMSVGLSAGAGWQLAQAMGGVLANDKMARLGIVEPRPAPYNEHANRKLAGMAMHATSKAPYNDPGLFLAQLNKLRVANVVSGAATRMLE